MNIKIRNVLVFSIALAIALTACDSSTLARNFPPPEEFSFPPHSQEAMDAAREACPDIPWDRFEGGFKESYSMRSYNIVVTKFVVFETTPHTGSAIEMVEVLVYWKWTKVEFNRWRWVVTDVTCSQITN